MITHEIPGKPVAQERGRIVRIGNRSTIKDPPKSWKGYASLLMQQAMGRNKPLAGAVELIVIAMWACPKSQERKRSPREACWRPKLPDLDNVIKCVQDAANGVMFIDDAQVCRIIATKRQAAQGEPPKVVVSVKELRT